MVTNQYFVTVYQPEDASFVEIEIRRDERPMSGCIAARASIDVVTMELKFTVWPNVQFHGDKSPHEAELIAEWFQKAAAVAKELSGLIFDRDDFNNEIVAEVREDGYIDVRANRRRASEVSE